MPPIFDHPIVDLQVRIEQLEKMSPQSDSIERMRRLSLQDLRAKLQAEIDKQTTEYT